MIDAAVYLRSLAAVGRRAGVNPRDRRVLAAMLLGYPTLEVAVRAGRALDHVVAPGHRRVRVEAPVFVVGHMRSGTTFLHRLLALDPGFKAPEAWELFLPAISLQRSARASMEFPAARGLARKLEAWLFSDFSDWHLTRWSSPEEDDWLFLHSAMSTTLELLTAQPSVAARYVIGDDLPDAARARSMRWHHRSLQRLAAGAPHRTLLGKNPQYMGWLRSLNQTYPDARFVMLQRDPAEAIASWLAMATTAWRVSLPASGRSDPRVEALFLASCARYRHAAAVWAELPQARKHRVGYDELILDPVSTVKRLYRHFDWALDAVAPELESAAADARRRVPGSRHQLRHFGIRPNRLRTELGGAGE